MVMSCCVLIFNNLMLYLSCATFHLPPWGHTLAMGDAFVSGLSKVCTILGATEKRRCCIRTMGHCLLEQTATVVVAGTNTHPWPGCYIFWVKWGDFPHLWRWCSLFSSKANRKLVCFYMHGIQSRISKQWAKVNGRNMTYQLKNNFPWSSAQLWRYKCPEESYIYQLMDLTAGNVLL